MKMKLTKLSLCPCGYPVLNEGIPLGTEYEVLAWITFEGELECGGCGNKIPVKIGYVGHRDDPTCLGLLPLEIFE